VTRAVRALVYEAPWQLVLREVDRPVPAPGEALVAVRASGICGSDIHGYTGSTGRRVPPLVMGHEVAGEVLEVGEGVEGYGAGSRVVIRSVESCGRCHPCRSGRATICLRRRSLGIHIPGAYADALVVPAGLLVPLPADVPWELGALVEPLAVAMHAVDVTPIPLLETVVVIGAGPIGLLAVLAARAAGAGRIIVTDRNSRRLAVAEALGAATVVDADDAVDTIRRLAGGHGAPAVLEAVGVAATARRSLAVAAPGASVTWLGNSEPVVELEMQDFVGRELTLRGAYGSDREFGRAIEAIASRRIDVAPLVEHRAPLEDGPRLMHELATGRLDALKVVLEPS
jgi:L-iditol 2-dehydrogenase